MLDEGGRFMQSSLLFSDSKNFIDKYTRFMTKDIYISLDMEKRFFDENDINNFFKDFKIIFMKEENMSRWCADKIIWKCAAQNIKLK